MTDDRPSVAVFRPDDGRLEAAVSALADAGVEPVADPMLAVDPTDATPERDADVVVFTSKTGVELVAEAGWTPADATTVSAIGAATADALRSADYAVDVVPEEYSSRGLVDALEPRIEGGGDAGSVPNEAVDRGPATSVEVARSDHGSDVLLDGLRAAGAAVHETVLYELRRPQDAGDSTELAAAGELDGVCFTSSLTVEHFFEAATERGVEAAARQGLEDAVVGVIGEPTAATARERGLDVDVVPASADVDELIADVVDAIE
ncbi:uroporphyrinogen-III synthase [Salinarchaeum chitinilyticum]